VTSKLSLALLADAENAKQEASRKDFMRKAAKSDPSNQLALDSDTSPEFGPWDM
jgi:hypothetical protein